MKAIVANVFFGGILGCLSCANSTQANPINPKSDFSRTKSASLSTRSSIAAVAPTFNLVDNVLNSGLYSRNIAPSLQHHQMTGLAEIDLQPLGFDYFSQPIDLETDCSLGFCASSELDDRPIGGAERLLSTQKQYVHRSPSADLVLGFQKAFWASGNQPKYWGFTTIERWGGNKQQQLNLPQLNYLNAPPVLPMGSSTLTFSGGGNRNLVAKAALDRNVNPDLEFDNFRGGVTYHKGIAKQLTMGVGFVYEDIFAGFTQLTYKSQILPVTTTVSLIAKDSNTDLHSHVRFQPSKSFVANYHHDSKAQKFDANYQIHPGFTLIARGNTKQKDYNAGIKIAVQNNYFSLTATAALDRQRNLQWQLNSQIGRFKFVHKSNKNKTNSELTNQLIDSDRFGFQCSTFVKYQTRLAKQEQQQFTVWGGKLASKTKIGRNRHQWSLDLGYGISEPGQGWIANGSVALQPDLFFKLNYQEISAVSDETKIKLELSSR